MQGLCKTVMVQYFKITDIKTESKSNYQQEVKNEKNENFISNYNNYTFN